ncbi:hypothetical protein ACI68E_000106 [Malassezia pachydermatis]|uniref:Uncharacterized protein n=1 Tax=Malassezia pachydermatis TaxID=77020 RepID=A0A0M8MR73_9BASI|nr:hypothetical protein Malapachy_1404 [Malassezia pachydermatis]KOS12694.1 hypothetical protein Malapachy_1404 [Malassezia pachydermatis]
MSTIQYRFPKDAWQVGVLIALFAYVDNAGPNSLGARIRNSIGGHATMDTIRNLAIAAHIGEALVMLFVNIRRNSSPKVTFKWVITTLLFGAPSWGAFSKVNNGIF